MAGHGGMAGGRRCVAASNRFASCHCVACTFMADVLPSSCYLLASCGTLFGTKWYYNR
jgi:hypothetical protein